MQAGKLEIHITMAKDNPLGSCVMSHVGPYHLYDSMNIIIKNFMYGYDECLRRIENELEFFIRVGDATEKDIMIYYPETYLHISLQVELAITIKRWVFEEGKNVTMFTFSPDAIHDLYDYIVDNSPEPIKE